MAKPKNKISNPDSHTVTRLISIIVILLTAAGVIWTAIFFNGIMAQISGDSFRLSEEDRESIETIDLEQLSILRAKIDKKNSLDTPRAGRLRNPFAEYAPETTPGVVTE